MKRLVVSSQEFEYVAYVVGTDPYDKNEYVVSWEHCEDKEDARVTSKRLIDMCKRNSSYVNLEVFTCEEDDWDIVSRQYRVSPVSVF